VTFRENSSNHHVKDDRTRQDVSVKVGAQARGARRQGKHHHASSSHGYSLTTTRRPSHDQVPPSRPPRPASRPVLRLPLHRAMMPSRRLVVHSTSCSMMWYPWTSRPRFAPRTICSATTSRRLRSLWWNELLHRAGEETTSAAGDVAGAEAEVARPLLARRTSRLNRHLLCNGVKRSRNLQHQLRTIRLRVLERKA